jgi:hypothetical protein
LSGSRGPFDRLAADTALDTGAPGVAPPVTPGGAAAAGPQQHTGEPRGGSPPPQFNSTQLGWQLVARLNHQDALSQARGVFEDPNSTLDDKTAALEALAEAARELEWASYGGGLPCDEIDCSEGGVDLKCRPPCDPDEVCWCTPGDPVPFEPPTSEPPMKKTGGGGAPKQAPSGPKAPPGSSDDPDSAAPDKRLEEARRTYSRKAPADGPDEDEGGEPPLGPPGGQVDGPRTFSVALAPPPPPPAQEEEEEEEEEEPQEEEPEGKAPEDERRTEGGPRQDEPADKPRTEGGPGKPPPVAPGGTWLGPDPDAVPPEPPNPDPEPPPPMPPAVIMIYDSEEERDAALDALNQGLREIGITKAKYAYDPETWSLVLVDAKKSTLLPENKHKPKNKAILNSDDPMVKESASLRSLVANVNEPDTAMVLKVVNNEFLSGTGQEVTTTMAQPFNPDLGNRPPVFYFNIEAYAAYRSAAADFIDTNFGGRDPLNPNAMLLNEIVEAEKIHEFRTTGRVTDANGDVIFVGDPANEEHRRFAHRGGVRRGVPVEGAADRVSTAAEGRFRERAGLAQRAGNTETFSGGFHEWRNARTEADGALHVAFMGPRGRQEMIIYHRADGGFLELDTQPNASVTFWRERERRR